MKVDGDANKVSRLCSTFLYTVMDTVYSVDISIYYNYIKLRLTIKPLFLCSDMERLL